MKKSFFTTGCAIAGCVLLCASSAMAGGVKGKVAASKEFQEYFNRTESSGTQKVDYYWEVENGVLPVLPPILDLQHRVAVALFHKDGKGAVGFVPQHPEVYGAQLVPGIIVAPPKVTLKFHNTDPFVHELFSAELGKLFEPELQSSKQTRQIQFTNPGVYKVGCKTTPHLVGWIVIEDGVVASKSPAEDGTFLFDEVAAGEYVLKVYFDGKVVASKEISVVDSDKEKDFAVAEMEMAPPSDDAKKKPGEETPAAKEGGSTKEETTEGDSAKTKQESK